MKIMQIRRRRPNGNSRVSNLDRFSKAIMAIRTEIRMRLSNPSMMTEWNVNTATENLMMKLCKNMSPFAVTEQK